MKLQDELREDLNRVRAEIRLDDGPVESAPDNHFQRQVRNSAHVDLLMQWAERLAAEVDELRERDASG